MPPPRTIITAEFLADVRRTGSLAEAAARLGHTKEYRQPLPQMSTWELVCEEVVDTEYDAAYYERVVAELFRRGISPAELEEMRLFAWETAGWLNFEKMLWDWCSLDEKDIRSAINWQLEAGEIDAPEAQRRLAYLERYAHPPPAPGTPPVTPP